MANQKILALAFVVAGTFVQASSVFHPLVDVCAHSLRHKHLNGGRYNINYTLKKDFADLNCSEEADHEEGLSPNIQCVYQPNGTHWNILGGCCKSCCDGLDVAPTIEEGYENACEVGGRFHPSLVPCLPPKTCDWNKPFAQNYCAETPAPTPTPPTPDRKCSDQNCPSGSKNKTDKVDFVWEGRDFATECCSWDEQTCFWLLDETRLPKLCELSPVLEYSEGGPPYYIPELTGTYHQEFDPDHYGFSVSEILDLDLDNPTPNLAGVCCKRGGTCSYRNCDAGGWKHMDVKPEDWASSRPSSFENCCAIDERTCQGMAYWNLVPEGEECRGNFVRENWPQKNHKKVVESSYNAECCIKQVQTTCGQFNRSQGGYGDNYLPDQLRSTQTTTNVIVVASMTDPPRSLLAMHLFVVSLVVIIFVV